MASANGTGGTPPQEDSEAVSPWTSIRVENRTARRMEKQRQHGEPTTGRRGCPLFGALVLGAAVLVVAVTR